MKQTAVPMPWFPMDDGFQQALSPTLEKLGWAREIRWAPVHPFGSLAICFAAEASQTHDFASPPCDGFAFVEEDSDQR